MGKNQIEDGFPHLHASLPACNEFLRFTTNVTPADLLVASIGGL